MIGARLEQSRSNAWLAICLLAAGLLGAAFFGDHNKAWLVAATLPALLAAAIWLSRPRPFAATIRENGLELHDTGETLAWSEIKAIVCDSRGSERFPITLELGRRKVQIPELLNVRSLALYQFLLDTVRPPQPTPLDSQLAEFYAKQRQRFGAQRVWHAAGVGPSSREWTGRGAAVIVAALLGSFIYVAYGLKAKQDALTSAGGIGIFVVMIAALVRLIITSQQRRIRSQRGFSVIVAPTGMALRQNEMKGELRWDELRDVRFRGKRRFGLTADQAAPGIELHVPGAVIKILDLYDRPLAAIHERIMQNWRGPS